MIIAEIHLTAGGTFDHAVIHHVKFDDLEKARTEYERVADLMTRHAERKNDVPKMVEVTGTEGSKCTLPLDQVRSIGLTDYAAANAQMAGVRDAFPNLFKM